MTIPELEPRTIQQPSADGRVLGLDALRGLAILLMCLSGIVPSLLPNWMYHGYYPNYFPNEAGEWIGEAANRFKFRGEWSAFTWVDWVFPMFLFAMGAAIPLALAGRRARGERVGRLALQIISRWLLLLFFGVYVGQVAPGLIDSPATTGTWWLALVAFALPFAIFARLPRDTPPQLARAIRLFGFISCAMLLLYLANRDGKSFSWGRHDIIILLLAHTFLVAALLWLILPGRWWWARLIVALPIMLLAHHEGIARDNGWQQELRWFGAIHPKVDEFAGRAMPYLNFQYTVGEDASGKPVRQSALNLHSSLHNATRGAVTVPEPMRPYLDLSPLWHFTWLKFLWCVIPGTIIGDLLLRRPVRDGTSTPRGAGWVFSALVLALTIGVFAGLRHYGFPAGSSAILRTPWITLLIALPFLLGLIAIMFIWRERFPRAFVPLAIFASIFTAIGLGLALAPWKGGFFERGISKGPPATLSWYLLSNGLSVFWLMMFALWIDVRGTRAFGLLTANGQNPMLAYLGIRNLLAPLVALPLLLPIAHWIGADSLRGWMTNLLGPNPWPLFIWALLQTLLLAVLIWLFTRRRIVWRA